MDEPKIKWLQSGDTSFVGYVSDVPVFRLHQENEHTWSAFLSYRGTIYDTIDRCKQWCEYPDQMKLADELVALAEKRRAK